MRKTFCDHKWRFFDVLQAFGFLSKWIRVWLNSRRSKKTMWDNFTFLFYQVYWRWSLSCFWEYLWRNFMKKACKICEWKISEWRFNFTEFYEKKMWLHTHWIREMIIFFGSHAHKFFSWKFIKKLNSVWSIFKYLQMFESSISIISENSLFLLLIFFVWLKSTSLFFSEELCFSYLV